MGGRTSVGAPPAPPPTTHHHHPPTHHPSPTHIYPPPPPAGETRLSQAQASARLSEQQQLTFSVEVVPAEGHRQAGYVKAAGVVPLTEAAAAAAAAPPAPPTPASAAAAAAAQLDVRLSVKDGGMALLTSVTPDLRWQGGQAAVELRLRGSLEQPVLSGTASVAKATLECPAVLRWPLTNVTAEVRAGGGLLTVEGLEARCGRRGTLRLRGTLPVYGPSGGGGSGGRDAPPTYRLAAEASGLELRLRNMYSGQYDASLVLTGSLACPTVGGSMRFSKGIVFIVPQGAPGGRLCLCGVERQAGWLLGLGGVFEARDQPQSPALRPFACRLSTLLSVPPRCRRGRQHRRGGRHRHPPHPQRAWWRGAGGVGGPGV